MEKNKPLQVLVVPSDRTGVSFFRSINPHIALENNYPDEFRVDIDYEPQLNDDVWLKQYDIIHYHRTIGPYEQMPALLEKLDNLGIITIMDLDDHWAPGPHHPAYRIIKNLKLDEKIVGNLKIARNVTTTTPIFAQEMSKFNKNVFVLPNAIDPNEPQFTPNLEPSDKIRIGWLGGSCKSFDTEILTENGWVYFPDLKEGVKVATLNPTTNELEYHEPTRYIKERYVGDMYVCNTKNINFKATGNHNMYVSEAKNLTHKKLEFKLTHAEDMWGKDYHYKKNCANTNEDIKYFKLPKIEQTPFDKNDYDEKSILMDDWLKIFGFWLADGWTTNTKGCHQVGVCQFKNNNFLIEISDILKKYGFKSDINKNGNRIVLHNRQLWLYLKQFGGANEKFIPREFLNNLSERQLRILLEWYLNGDGSKEKSGEYIRLRGYTVSKQLADDLMELAFKIGSAASIKNRGKRIPNVSLKENGKERIIIPNFDAYQVSFYEKNSKHNQLTPLVRKEDLYKEYYDDYVYCVEVKNHIIHVRRNGKSMWTGNSHKNDLELLNGVVSKLKSDGLLDKIQFVLCGFDLRGTHTDIDQATGQQKTRNILPRESVWYQYERIFTDDYKSISPEYRDFLLKFKQEEYPNVANEPYRRVWTKHISTYATNYNLFDISLAPLETNMFNKVKSQLKVIEAGFHKKAIIAQDFGPYQLDIKNAIKFGGEFDMTANGILINPNKNHKDWYSAIKKLVNNPSLIKVLQENLYNTVKDLYSIEKVTEDRKNLYTNLVNKMTEKTKKLTYA
jgi:glycosyltransferase involved in cell wall biosynthesis